MKTIDRLRQLIADSCAVRGDLIVEKASLRGFGIDSLRVMDLMLTIEGEFGIQFNLEDLDGIHTVGELASYVDRLRQQSGEHATCKSPEDL
jgi:acyl carrier protein